MIESDAVAESDADLETVMAVDSETVAESDDDAEAVKDRDSDTVDVSAAETDDAIDGVSVRTGISDRTMMIRAESEAVTESEAE